MSITHLHKNVSWLSDQRYLISPGALKIDDDNAEMGEFDFFTSLVPQRDLCIPEIEIKS